MSLDEIIAVAVVAWVLLYLTLTPLFNRLRVWWSVWRWEHGGWREHRRQVRRKRYAGKD